MACLFPSLCVALSLYGDELFSGKFLQRSLYFCLVSFWLAWIKLFTEKDETCRVRERVLCVV